MSSVETAGAPWSDDELRACVDAYLRLLDSQIRGTKLSKSEVRARVLAESLAGRVPSAYEMRMQNISAVAGEMGLPTVAGYAPLPNVGGGVRGRLGGMLNARRDDFPSVFAESSDAVPTAAPQYWTNLYTTETWEVAGRRGHTITGFTAPRTSGPGGYKQVMFDRVEIGDIFLCYVVGAMKWMGALRIDGAAFEDDEPIWGSDEEGRVRYPIRFRVSPLVVIDDIEHGIPRDEGLPSLPQQTDGAKRGFFNMGMREVAAEDAEHLLGLLRVAASGLEGVHPGPRLTPDWLMEVTNWAPDKLEELADALQGASPQVVLAGPPGTSKTWVARHLVRYLTQDDPRRTRLVQFHPSYGYEDFIEGLRPVADRGAVSFKPVKGVVLDIVAGRRNKQGEQFYLVIDEMNRANLGRVLGELMFLFEYRDQKIDLRYTKKFALPRWLRFIGTMNTADRSIRSIDIALRRRFDIFECPPDVEILERYYSREERENEITDLYDGFGRLNEKLTETLDKHHTIGHAFFMAPTMTAALMHSIWNRKVGPLIDEYLFDQPDVAEGFTLRAFWPSIPDAD